mgnify:CR=1 FL=1
MTRRERIEKTLRFEQPDRPPHFEQTFELAAEAFGIDYPSEDEFARASGSELDNLFARTAEIYARTVERFRWDAVTVWRPAFRNEAQYRFLPVLRRTLDPDVPIGSFIWGGMVSIDSVTDHMQFAIDLAEHPDHVHQWAREMLRSALEHGRRLVDAGCELIDVASDVAYNSGTFISPRQFGEFITPYAAQLIDSLKRAGATVIFHSDGNLMAVMNDILAMAPHALHSIDPMAGMDIARVKQFTHGRIALIGNVQCSLLQDGPDEKIIASAKYCLDHGAPGGGYIFSSSNTIFKGLPLRNYLVMCEYFWKRYGVVCA